MCLAHEQISFGKTARLRNAFEGGGVTFERGAYLKTTAHAAHCCVRAEQVPRCSMNYETLSTEDSDDECVCCFRRLLCPFPRMELLSQNSENMDSRTSVAVEIQETYQAALESLKKTDGIITSAIASHFSELRHGEMERIEWYRDEISWYNSNRRQIFKALLTLLELYQDTYAESTSENSLSFDILPQVRSLQRDLQAWTRTRTEQAQVERNLQRAFKVRRPGRARVTGQPSDSEYTDFSGADTDAP